jgi:hypothetical protein
MVAHVKRNDSLAVVLRNGDWEIERKMAPSPDAAVGIAVMMLARRGDDLQAGDCLKVLSPN